MKLGWWVPFSRVVKFVRAAEIGCLLGRECLEFGGFSPEVGRMEAGFAGFSGSCVQSWWRRHGYLASGGMGMEGGVAILSWGVYKS